MTSLLFNCTALQEPLSEPNEFNYISELEFPNIPIVILTPVNSLVAEPEFQQ